MTGVNGAGLAVALVFGRNLPATPHRLHVRINGEGELVVGVPA